MRRVDPFFSSSSSEGEGEEVPSLDRKRQRRGYSSFFRRDVRHDGESSSRNGDSPSPLPPRPNPRRYWALWEGSGEPETGRGGNAAASAAEGAAAMAAAAAEPSLSSPISAATLAAIRRELELAEYNAFMQHQIDDRRAQIDEHKRQIAVLEGELAALQHELDATTTIPRLLGGGPHEETKRAADEFRRFWDKDLPASVRHDKELAWRILRSKAPQPAPFQDMLWRNPDCPLRGDRDILMASLDKGLHKGMRIRWSDDMAQDRELVLRFFATRPELVASYDPRDRSGLPGPRRSEYWADPDAFRAFAFSPQTRQYRSSGYRFWPSSGVHTMFDPALLRDPNVVADLILHMCRTGSAAGWNDSVVKEAFPAGVQPSQQQPLLDDARFALRLADGLLGVDESHLDLCPVTYGTLSSRLREMPDVALAYFRAWGRSIFDAPLALASDGELWSELWRAATDSCPVVVYDSFFKRYSNLRPPSSVLSKELVLNLLDEAKTSGRTQNRLQQLRDFFPHLPPEIQQDRDVNAHMVLFSAQARSTELEKHLAPECIRSGPFWIELVEKHRCPCNAWKFVPVDVASDEALTWAWARNARPVEGSVDWVADATAAFPHLDVLSDRQVLLNWLPELCSRSERGAELFRQIPAECLVKDLWLELLAKEEGTPRDYLSHVPQILRQDHDVVGAQLRLCTLRPDLFRTVYFTLPLELQVPFAPLLAEAILNSTSSYPLPPMLLRLPEVARSAIATGWGPGVAGFSGVALRNSPWSRDREFLLSVARDASLTRVWKYLPDVVRRDKGFVLKMLSIRGVEPSVLGGDLLNDFDVRCALFVMSHAESAAVRFVPSACDLELAREARECLGRYVGLETFMRGVVGRSRPPRSGRSVHRDRFSSTILRRSPAALLNQDGYTLQALRERLREYLGAPTDDHVAILRNVSNAVTKYGF
jgi:hypothetical protein